MDFMKLFKSLEELLYEVIVMLVFFPKTLWLTLRYPQRMMDYADTELGDVLSEQYKDTLSPPLFLMLCVALSYLAERAVPGSLDTSALPSFLRDSQNLLAFRVLIFSLVPLAFSLRLLRGLGQPLDRDTLRAPFFAQCFVAAPLAMIVGLAQALRNLPLAHAGLISTVLLLLGIGWYLRQQAWWLRTKLALPMWRCWAATLLVTLLTVIAFILFALAILVVNR
jgi:hypothetical protein